MCNNPERHTTTLLLSHNIMELGAIKNDTNETTATRRSNKENKENTNQGCVAPRRWAAVARRSVYDFTLRPVTSPKTGRFSHELQAKK